VTPSIDDLYRAAIKLHQQGQAGKAAQLYDAILAQQPRHAGALHLKGVLALQSGDHDTAIALIQRSLAIEPRHGLALANLGVAYRAARRFDEGIEALRKAVALDANSADAWNNLGQMLVRTGEVREAVEANSRALALQPNRPGLRGRLLFARNYLGETDPVGLAQEARALGAELEQRVHPRTSHPNDPDPNRRIRLGLVSGDLKKHPVGRFLTAWLKELDGDRIEAIAYSTNSDSDEVTDEIRAATSQWFDVWQLGHEALDAKIFGDGIDVLLDLSGWSGDVRLEMFARKPAPVAFTWLGYFATTGMTAIDYVLANKWVIPETEENQWTEKPWRMPDTYLCFAVPNESPAVSPLPALSTGRITFGSFNNFNKINDGTMAAWSKLLAAVPNSRLILRSSGHYPPGVEARLGKRLNEMGIGPDQVRVDPKITNYPAHLASYAEIDIALDPFPYNGGTTTVEALYMGVPVLVRAGDRYVAHMGESILHNTGLTDWLAPNESAYAALGVAKASDLEALAALRASLRDRMVSSPLFDAPRFARNFEAAVRGMWQVWCASHRRA